MKIGDRCFVRGYIDEIRKDTVIVRNDGGYFGTVPSEIICGEIPERKMGMDNLKPCPFRYHGDMSLTAEGEYHYKDVFAPCLQEECPCFHVNYGDAYCDRNGAYMKLGRKEE